MIDRDPRTAPAPKVTSVVLWAALAHNLLRVPLDALMS